MLSLVVSIMNRWNKISRAAFALPTVLISSIIMMVVLMAALVSVASVDAVLRDQYYNRLAKEASEAGSAMAFTCLKANSFVPASEWTDAHPLRPNTDCKGNEITGMQDYIVSDGNIRVTFSVPRPHSVGGAQRVTSNGSVDRLRSSSSSAVYRTFSATSVSSVGAQSSFGSITMGTSFLPTGSPTSDPNNGAQFSLIKPDGAVVSVGQNLDGRLGNGTANPKEASPVQFQLPSTDKKARAVFSDISGTGRYVSVVTTGGNVYTSGPNEAGELGNGEVGNGVIPTTNSSYKSYASTPVLFGKNSGGIKGKYVKPIYYKPYSSAATFVLTEDGKNIYVAGACNAGTLGIGNGTGRCVTSEKDDAKKIVDPVRIALPVYNISDPGTIIASNSSTGSDLAPDYFSTRLSSFVRMQNGDVYGWGPNFTGLMGTGSYDTTNPTIANGVIVPTPVKITALKSDTTPTAAAVVSSGRSLYIIDANGQAWAAGDNQYGNLMGAGSYLREMGSQSDCLAKGNGTDNKLYSSNYWNSSGSNNPAKTDCNAKNANPTALFEPWPDGTLRLRKNVTSTTRTDMAQFWCMTSGTASGQNVTMIDCNSSMPANQQWTVSTTPNKRSVKISKFIGATEVCVEKVYWGNPTTANNCTSNNGNQEWELGRLNTPVPYLRPVPSLPSGKKFTKIIPGDSNVLVLDDSGEAWASGASIRGESCIGGSTNGSAPDIRATAGLKKITFPSLPTGVKVGDIAVSQMQPEYGGNDGNKYNNTFFLMSDGTIYGCGANDFGQMGIGVQNANSYSTPTLMSELDAMGVKAKAIQVGLGTVVILSTSGQVYAVGNNSHGQIGNPDVTAMFTSKPTLNSYVTNINQILY